MKIIFKNNLENFSLPLPIYKTLHIADAVSKDGEEFFILAGLDGKLVAQLKKFSLDENDIELQKNTGDKNRFGIGSYEDWYKKDRIPFALVHKDTVALAALVWFGPKPLGAKSIKFGKEKAYEVQKKWHTIVFRSYIPFRGKGMMKDFAKFAIDVYKKQFTNIMLWAGMDDRNNAVIKLSSYLGFKVGKEVSDLASNWLVMTNKIS